MTFLCASALWALLLAVRFCALAARVSRHIVVHVLFALRRVEKGAGSDRWTADSFRKLSHDYWIHLAIFDVAGLFIVLDRWRTVQKFTVLLFFCTWGFAEALDASLMRFHINLKVLNEFIVWWCSSVIGLSKAWNNRVMLWTRSLIFKQPVSISSYTLPQLCPATSISLLKPISSSWGC